MATPGYGRIYVSAGATPQTLHATPGTFNKVTAFAANGVSGGGCTPSHTNDNLVFSTNSAGRPPTVADVHANLSFTVGAAGLYRFAIYRDNAVIEGSERQITCTNTSSPVYSVNLFAICEVSADGEPTFDIRAASDQVSPAITVVYGALEARIA